MKTAYYLKSKFLLITLGILTMGVFNGCQEASLESDVIEFNTEKSAILESVPTNGTLPSGALYEIVLPDFWNVLPQKVLLVYAHGYRDADKSVILPNDLIAGIPIKDFILSQNMGYASTSYRENGLVVLEGIEDIVLLRTTITNFFITNPGYAPPEAIILVGPSEGGLITVLTIEQHPGLFNAAIATCCPIGNFYDQLHYYGDAHVLFKYFFGPSINSINLGSPKRLSKNTISAWENGSLQEAIIGVLQHDYLHNGGNKILQYLNCSNIPADINNPEAVVMTILDVLRFPIKATNDAISRLGGNPYNNKYPKRIYLGSDNDRKLNLTIERIKTNDWETAAQNVAEYFETTGLLFTPLVTMHNLNDHISFYEHQTEYLSKVNSNSPFPAFLIQIPVSDCCGHCNFNAQDIMTALGSLLP
ncbi:MAG: hypothetical protein HQ521_11375 [Bacteroidetes bacterium]|nr:hypothetical protein [Bacteroidota bacterium]